MRFPWELHNHQGRQVVLVFVCVGGMACLCFCWRQAEGGVGGARLAERGRTDS